jgi:hypothetical protein
MTPIQHTRTVAAQTPHERFTATPTTIAAHATDSRCADTMVNARAMAVGVPQNRFAATLTEIAAVTR